MCIAIHATYTENAAVEQKFIFLCFLINRIDFDDPSTTRAGNLAKSAVLAALEEEERGRGNQNPGEFKRSVIPDGFSSNTPNVRWRGKSPQANIGLLSFFASVFVPPQWMS